MLIFISYTWQYIQENVNTYQFYKQRNVHVLFSLEHINSVLPLKEGLHYTWAHLLETQLSGLACLCQSTTCIYYVTYSVVCALTFMSILLSKRSSPKLTSIVLRLWKGHSTTSWFALLILHCNTAFWLAESTSLVFT